MKTNIFNSALEKLNQLISNCEKQKKRIEAVGGFQNLTVVDANKIIVDSKNLKARMDQFLTAEVYHMIGMGNLSAVQTQVFCNAVKRLCALRCLIEQLFGLRTISCNQEKVSSYNCRVMMLELKSNGETNTVKGPSGQEGGKEDAQA